jgi:hypothetical protein
VRLDEHEDGDATFEAEEAASAASRPLHYLGWVARFSPGRGVGAIRSESGREVVFDLRFVRLAGGGPGERARDRLHEGDRIGFDVGWTSRGLRVTWIRPLDEAAPAATPTRPGDA